MGQIETLFWRQARAVKPIRFNVYLFIEFGLLIRAAVVYFGRDIIASSNAECNFMVVFEILNAFSVVHQKHMRFIHFHRFRFGPPHPNRYNRQ